MTGLITVPFHIGDFLSGTLHMDTLEKGAYIMLLMAHYQTGEQGLKNDETELARIAGVSSKVWKRIKPRLEEKFVVSDSHWTSKKCVEVLRKVAEKSSKQRAKILKYHEERRTAEELQKNQPKPKPKPVEEKEIDKSISKKKTSLCPDDFQPNETTLLVIRDLGLTPRQVADEIQRMQDWSRAGLKRKADWQGTFRNWIKRNRPPPGQQGKTDMADYMDNIFKEAERRKNEMGLSIEGSNQRGHSNPPEAVIPLLEAADGKR